MNEDVWIDAAKEGAIFAHNIKTLRQYRGWTAKELGRRSGLTSAAISAIEREAKQRSPYILTALVLCKTLGVDIGEMVKERRETLYDWRNYFNDTVNNNTGLR